jgi:predicted kinase
MTTDTPELLLLVGLAGAGKSTYAASLAATHTTISRDAVRAALVAAEGSADNGYQYTPENEARVSAQCLRLWQEAVSARRSVVVDNCNLRKSYHNRWRSLANAAQYRFETRHFPITLAEAMRRNEKRDRAKVVPTALLMRQHKLYLHLVGRRTPVLADGATKVVVCDVEAMVWPVKGKDGLLRRKRGGVGEADEPRCDIINMVKQFAVDAQASLVFLSASVGDTAVAVRWIQYYFNTVHVELYTRGEVANDDADDRWKEALFWQHIGTRYCVRGVFDHDEEALRFWHDVGVGAVVNVQADYYLD